jgi:6-phosphogluconolactonase/glucosamine-6-phosphate isomerase/deaminase
MTIIECKDEKSWVDTINDWLVREIQTHQARRLFLPAGETPRPLYRSWQAGSSPMSEVLKSITLVQLDEVLNGARPFQRFFEETLPDFQSQFEFIDQAEQGADIAVLGLGLNGHIAFHEPNIAPELYSGCLELSPETTNRLQLPPRTRGITYGLGAFLRAKSIALIVRGAAKENILVQVLRHQSELPAAGLKDHPRLTVITDFKIKPIF